MTIAIISDIHDNLANLAKCLNWCQTKKIKIIICCGDISTADTLDYLAATFSGQVLIVTGNAELFTDETIKKYPSIKSYGSQGIVKISKLNIGFCHEPKKIEILLKQATESTANKLHFIFYGHTHKPWLEKRKEIIIANPGNLAGIFHQATFATLNTATKKLVLQIVANL